MKIFKVDSNKNTWIKNGSFLDSSVRIQDVSVGLVENISIFIIETETTGDVQAYLDKDNPIKLFTTSDESEIALANSVTLTHEPDYGYKLNVCCYEETNGGEYSNTLHVSIDGTEYQFDISCTVVEQDHKLIEMLQNNNFTITNDYELAFYETDTDEVEPSAILLNKKRKEFILSLFEMTGFLNSYRSLEAVLTYFGYGELLAIRELWVNAEGLYQSTDITSQIQRFIDHRLKGFKKTNQLQLVYQINTPTGEYDNDLLPIYESVLYDTDSVMVKLHAVRRILTDPNNGYIPLNVKLVDIIGEHTTPSEIYIKQWSVFGVHRNTNLTPDVDITLDIDATKETLIENNSVILSQPHMVDNTTESLKYKDGEDSGFFNDTYFEIDRIVDDSTTLVKDEYLKSYYNGDFGLFRCEVTSETQNVFLRYSFALLSSDGTPLLESGVKAMTNFDNTILIGIRETGTYKLAVYLYDGYGSTKVMYSDTFEVLNQPSDFVVARSVDASGDIDKSAMLISTFRGDTGNSVYDTIDNTTELFKYVDEYDARSLHTRLVDASDTPIARFGTTTIANQGYTHSRVNMYFETLEPDTYTIGLRFFPHEPYTYVSANYTGNEYSFYAQLAEAINSNPYWNENFRASLSMINLSGEYTNVQANLIITCITAGYMEHMIDLDIPQQAVVQKKDFEIYSKYAGYARMYVNAYGTSGSLLINGVDVGTFTFSDYNDLADKITPLINGHVVHDPFRNIPTLWLDEDTRLEHPSFVPVHACPIGVLENSLVFEQYGSDFNIGESFHAFTSTKQEIVNLKWTLSKAITGEVVDEQFTRVYRNRLYEAGTYNLKLETVDQYGINTKERKGCLVVV